MCNMVVNYIKCIYKVKRIVIMVKKEVLGMIKKVLGSLYFGLQKIKI